MPHPALVAVLGMTLAGGAAVFRALARQRWQHEASRLGLRSNGPLGYEGSHRGVRVQVRRDLNETAEVRIELDPALDLGVRVSPARELLFDDERSWGTGADKLRLRAFLRSLELRAQLRRVARRVHLQDDWLAVAGARRGSRQLEQTLNEAVELTRAIDSARANVPVARAHRDYVGLWDELAAERGLRLSRAPLELSGQLRAGEVSLRALRMGTGFEVVVSVGYPGSARHMPDDARNYVEKAHADLLHELSAASESVSFRARGLVLRCRGPHRPRTALRLAELAAELLELVHAGLLRAPRGPYR